MAQEVVRRERGCGLPVTMKTDENVEKVRTCKNRSSFRHQKDNGGVEYRHRNGETNFSNKFEREMCVPIWMKRIHQVLATKQIPTLEHSVFIIV